MTVAQIQDDIFDLELNATTLWDVQLSGGRTADLSTAVERGTGAPFSGFARAARPESGCWRCCAARARTPPRCCSLSSNRVAGDRAPAMARGDRAGRRRVRRLVRSRRARRTSLRRSARTSPRSCTCSGRPPKAAVGYVEFGPTQAMDDEDADRDDAGQRPHGEPAGADRRHRRSSTARSPVDGTAAHKSATATIRTGDLPLGMPPLTRVGDGHEGFMVVPVLSGGHGGGHHHQRRAARSSGTTPTLATCNSIARGCPSTARTCIYNAANISGAPSEASELVRVALDGTSTSSVPVPLLAHDFVEHADGTLAAIVVEYRDFQGTQLRGDKIVEIAPGRNPADGVERLGLLRSRRRQERRHRAGLDVRERARLRPGRRRLLPGDAELQQHRAHQPADARVRVGAGVERRDAHLRAWGSALPAPAPVSGARQPHPDHGQRRQSGERIACARIRAGPRGEDRDAGVELHRRPPASTRSCWASRSVSTTAAHSSTGPQRARWSAWTRPAPGSGS